MRAPKASLIVFIKLPAARTVQSLIRKAVKVRKLGG